MSTFPLLTRLSILPRLPAKFEEVAQSVARDCRYQRFCLDNRPRIGDGIKRLKILSRLPAGIAGTADIAEISKIGESVA